MNSRIIFFSITLLFSSAAAIDITTLLDRYPAFSTFNRYLTQTQIADVINSRQPPFTILVVDNSNISPLSGMPPDVLKKIMMAHVVLDYFDVEKLKNLQDKSVLATTLFQTTGQAVDNQGYLNITDLSTGNVVFGSAAKGATLGSNLIMSVETRPYDLSVVQVSNVIVPLGIDNPTNTNSSSANSTSATSPSSPLVVPIPTASPTKPPVASPTNTPAASPAKPPAASPSPSPAKPPAASPSPAMPPAASPTNAPTVSPTKPPAASPTNTPIASPTNTPTASPIMPPTPSPRKMLSPAKSPSPAPSNIKAPAAAPNSPSPMTIAGTPAPTSNAPEKHNSSVGTALGVSAGIIAAIVSSNLFLVLMA